MTATTLRAEVPTPMRDHPASLLTLTAVEVRKAVDTRAGRWLLLAAALLSLGAGAIGAFVVPAEQRTYTSISTLVFSLSVFLLPVVAILLVTSEWSQRSAMTTFTLTPRRARVLAAKTLATLVLCVVGWAVNIGIAALATAVASHPAGPAGEPVWGLSAGGLGRSLLFLTLSVGLGFGFALLFLNSPAAIVLNFVLPLVWAILAAVIPWLREHLQAWLDPGTSWGLLLSSTPNGPGSGQNGQGPLTQVQTALTGQQWAQIGVTTAVWIGIPAAIGAWRMLTREVS